MQQESLCNYLLKTQFEAGMVSSIEDTEKMRKIINGVIKKLIREERMLMVVEDDVILEKRMLSIHPNYVEQ